MIEVEQVIQEYGELRSSGHSPKDALRQVRPLIDQLSKRDRDRLVVEIRAYEEKGPQYPEAETVTGTPNPEPQAPEKPKNPAIRPIKSLKRTTGEVSAVNNDTQPKPPASVNCPKCGKMNRLGEIICVHCGSLLKPVEEQAATKQLQIDDPRTDFFGVNSELFLRVRHSGEIIQLRPQTSEHELIVGRADSKGVVAPDIDLSPHDGAQRGVSRMHMSIQFKPSQQHLLIIDMGSVNGLFVNGQKLAMQETRVLRHGDQLRLGELILDVAFRHG